MPNLKAVYFAPDGKYFATYNECLEYEELCELVEFLEPEIKFYNFPLDIYAMITLIKTRYTIKKRLDIVEASSSIISDVNPTSEDI